MSRWIQNFLIAIVGVLSIACSVAGNNDRLVYKFENDEFILEKECVSVLKVGNSEFKNRHFLWIELKKNANCSDKLNELFMRNVSKSFSLFFNEIEVSSPSSIWTEMMTEKSYAQPVLNEIILQSIINAYKNKGAII
ncbi:hypothetical protein ABRP32_15045 [Providencia manganoxydans]|uniref:hypothetical protein n=1 Tax=Providencia TaxID=586 RepID=UPI0024B0A30A